MVPPVARTTTFGRAGLLAGAAGGAAGAAGLAAGGGAGLVAGGAAGFPAACAKGGTAPPATTNRRTATHSVDRRRFMVTSYFVSKTMTGPHAVKRMLPMA